MKKISVMLLSLILALLSSCTHGEALAKAEITPFQGLLTMEKNNFPISEPDSEPSYFVSMHNYSELSISINYPQISGLVDEEVENVINDKIKAMFLANFLNNWEWHGLSVEATYEVTLKTPLYFSLICSSEPYVAETAHPSWFKFGLTFNLETGDLLSVGEVITIQQFQEFIQTGDYEIEPSSLKEVMSFENLADMPQFTSVISSDSLNYCSFYLTESSICYLKSISHAFGDYATVVLPNEP